MRQYATSPDEKQAANPRNLEQGPQTIWSVGEPDPNSSSHPWMGSIPSTESSTASLERLIRDLVPSNPTPPPFKLEVNGFVKRKPTIIDDSTHSQAFSFVAPLPAPTSSTFYSVPNDAPCLRGPVFSRLKGWNSGDVIGTLGLDRCAVEGQLSRVLLLSSKGELTVDESEKDDEELWNRRNKEMMIPPWLPLSKPVAFKDTESQIEGVETEDPTSTLQDCLRCFVEDKSRNTRWLVAPQSLYGWDQNLLLEELNDLVKQINEETLASKREPITYLQLQVQLPSSFISLHFKSQSYSPITLLARTPWWLKSYSFVAFDMIVLFQNLLSLNKNGILFWTSMWCLSLSFILEIFRQPLSIHNSIGMAWSMKRWIKIECSKALSEREVLEILRVQEGGEGVGIPRVKLSEDGWYRISGTDERKWVEDQGERLKAAIRERRSGDLSDEWEIIVDAEKK